MKCPACGKEARDPILYCDWCHEERAMVDLIDPDELLGLIEDAIGNYRNHPIVTLLGYWMLVLNATLDYLSGDPEPLKELAGEE